MLRRSTKRYPWIENLKTTVRNKSPIRTHASVYDGVPLSFGGNTNIRLIEILYDHPAVQAEQYEFRCRVHVRSVKDRVPYTAVSYVWGEDTNTHHISVNGRPFSVRNNLFDLLLELKRQKHESLLWIDALCINQDNIRERNHQVALMSQIYSKATHVIVWLGTADKALAQAMTNLVDYESWRKQAMILEDSEIASYVPKDDMLVFTRHEYWRRAWIVQELVLAPDFSICCGSYEVSSGTFNKFLDDLRADSSWETPHGIATEWIISRSLPVKLMDMRKQWQSADNRTYINPWDLVDKKACADQRDRVYSMIAFMNPARAITPDYSKSAQELFMHIVDHHLEWDDAFLRNVWNLGGLLALDIDANAWMNILDPLLHRHAQISGSQ